MTLTLKAREELIRRIVTTKEQWYIEEPTEFTRRKVYHVESMDEFREVTKERGKPIEHIKNETVDLFSVYQQEDELYEA